MKTRILIGQLIIALIIVMVPSTSFAVEKNNTSGGNGDIISPSAKAEYSSDQVMVVYKDSASKSEIKSYANDIDAENVETHTETEMDYSVVDVPKGTGLEEAMEEYADDPAVDYVQPNYVYRLIEDTQKSDKTQISEVEKAMSNRLSQTTQSNPLNLQNSVTTSTTTSDPYASKQWQLGDVYTSLAKTEFAGLKAQPVKVAVIDTGVDIGHPDLQDCLDKSHCVSAVNSTNINSLPTLTKDADKEDGHGTHVSGIIGATANNGKGGSGVFNAVVGNNVLKLIVVGVFQYDYEGDLIAYSSDIINGLYYAKSQGVKVVNLSLGTYGRDPAEEAAVNSCVNSGIAVVCAAGNDSSSSPSYPAAFSNSISVAALEKSSTGKISDAYYSNWGSTIDISAPGSSIYSTTSRSVKSSGYMYLSGTSMASPVVAACAAIMYTINPNISVSQVKNGLYTTAYDLYTSGWDKYTGYGDVDSEGAVWAGYQTRMPSPVTAKARLVGYNDVKISWNTVTGATAYRVYYKRVGGSKYYRIATVSSSSGVTSVIKKDLTNGTRYRFMVVPCKTLDNKYCEGRGYTSDLYTLKKLNTPNVSKYSSNVVKVKWNNIYGESGYQISKSSRKSSINIVTTYDTTTGSYLKISASRYKTYYYRVRSYKKTSTGDIIYGPWSYAKVYKLK